MKGSHCALRRRKTTRRSFQARADERACPAGGGPPFVSVLQQYAGSSGENRQKTSPIPSCFQPRGICPTVMRAQPCPQRCFFTTAAWRSKAPSLRKDAQTFLKRGPPRRGAAVQKPDTYLALLPLEEYTGALLKSGLVVFLGGRRAVKLRARLRKKRLESLTELYTRVRDEQFGALCSTSRLNRLEGRVGEKQP